MPRVFQRLRENQILTIGGRDWRILTGGGHSPEMACLHCAELGILISGDQVLPRITPNIGVNSAEMAGNPLLRFLETLERFAALPADTLVLPSHNEPFRGLHRRLEALDAHHQERLALLLDACTEPSTIAQLIRADVPPAAVGLQRAAGRGRDAGARQPATIRVLLPDPRKRSGGSSSRPGHRIVKARGSFLKKRTKNVTPKHPISRVRLRGVR